MAVSGLDKEALALWFEASNIPIRPQAKVVEVAA
jgi:hypothetical protein